MKRILAALCALALLLTGCAPSGGGQEETDGGTAIAGLTYEGSMELRYARGFTGDYYQGGYVALHMDDGRSYLVVPEDGAAPQGAADYIILQQPLDSIYLVAAASMCFFDGMDRLDAIRLSGTKQESWYIENAAAAMAAGDILYAGKYSAPDYELILSQGCDLAVESTMIYHSPEVQEKLEELGIPVLVDRASYEDHPLGRTEWVKVYGALLGCGAQAEALFEEQAAMVERLSGLEQTGKTVAYFYVTTTGTVSVRKSADYVPVMIGLAGGEYVFQELGDESASSSVTMTMEEFYAQARDADYLLYNATIDDPLDAVDDLLGKSELFENFKAVREGNVWCTGKYLYQATDILGTLIWDIHLMLAGESDPAAYTFIHELS